MPYLVQRLLLTLLVLLATSMLAFSLTHLAGDPAAAVAGAGASPADIEAARTLYGFDQPIWQQYLTWIGRAVGGTSVARSTCACRSSKSCLNTRRSPSRSD